MEKEEWKPFSNALNKSDRKEFDDMLDIPRLYALACSNSCQLVPLHPVIMAILFHHYKELKECKSEIERMQEARVSYNNSSKNKELTIKEEVPTSLASYFVRNNAN
jgi:hypothetical protein